VGGVGGGGGSQGGEFRYLGILVLNNGGWCDCGWGPTGVFYGSLGLVVSGGGRRIGCWLGWEPRWGWFH